MGSALLLRMHNACCFLSVMSTNQSNSKWELARVNTLEQITEKSGVNNACLTVQL